ncbi:hypothetical protein B0H19DRAFT_964488 [Mycena capillaripes]|nr:hypothetical protein B0H19DRAFT_964488 [Mycena capillaripes]
MPLPAHVQHTAYAPYSPAGPVIQIVYTDDAVTKLSDSVRRRCFNCGTTEKSTWRRSSLSPGKVLCNKCGLYERTHSRPRPQQFPHKRGTPASSTVRSADEVSPSIRFPLFCTRSSVVLILPLLTTHLFIRSRFRPTTNPNNIRNTHRRRRRCTRLYGRIRIPRPMIPTTATQLKMPARLRRRAVVQKRLVAGENERDK